MKALRLACVVVSAGLWVLAAFIWNSTAMPMPVFPKGPKPLSHAVLSYTNRMGDKDFVCIDQERCDPSKGFMGKATGHLYATAQDAEQGIPARTRR